MDGTFELYMDAFGGNYLVTLYEIFEDESGFDAELVELGKYPLKLTDITKLQNRSIEIVSIQDREKKYAPLMLSQRHIIGYLHYIGKYSDVCRYNAVCNMEMNGLWGMDFDDEEQMKSCFFYRGVLAVGDKEFQTVGHVIIIFPDRLNLTKCVILREDSKEFVEPLYDYKTHSLIATDSWMSKLQKRERITTLEDDRYDFSVKIGDEIRIVSKPQKPKSYPALLMSKGDEQIKIEEMGLSVRTCNCLKQVGIRTMSDITNRTEREMLKVRNLGRSSLDEIICALAQYHKSLRKE